MLPKQPPVHQFNTGTVPDGESQLAKHYAKYGLNCLYMRSAFDNGGHDYASEQEREIEPFDRFGWGYVGDGYHNTTRYGELETDDVRKNSLGVVMRNWVRLICANNIMTCCRFRACSIPWHIIYIAIVPTLLLGITALSLYYMTRITTLASWSIGLSDYF